VTRLGRGLDQASPRAQRKDTGRRLGFAALLWTARTPTARGGYRPHDSLTTFHTSASSAYCLIGYSQGADVLPFAVNRLPEATRARVALAASWECPSTRCLNFT